MTEAEAEYIAELEAANLDMNQKIQKLKSEIKKPTQCNPADFALYETLLNTFYVFCGTNQIEPDPVAEYVRVSLQMKANQKGQDNEMFKLYQTTRPD